MPFLLFGSSPDLVIPGNLSVLQNANIGGDARVTGNLYVTQGNLIVTNVREQISESVSITNFGTSAALSVFQNGSTVPIANFSDSVGVALMLNTPSSVSIGTAVQPTSGNVLRVAGSAEVAGNLFLGTSNNALYAPAVWLQGNYRYAGTTKSTDPLWIGTGAGPNNGGVIRYSANNPGGSTGMWVDWGNVGVTGGVLSINYRDSGYGLNSVNSFGAWTHTGAFETSSLTVDTSATVVGNLAVSGVLSGNGSGLTGITFNYFQPWNGISTSNIWSVGNTAVIGNLSATRVFGNIASTTGLTSSQVTSALGFTPVGGTAGSGTTINSGAPVFGGSLSNGMTGITASWAALFNQTVILNAPSRVSRWPGSGHNGWNIWGSSDGSFNWYYGSAADTGGSTVSYINQSNGSFNASSDARLKRDVANIGYGLAEVLQLRPVNFRYTHNNDPQIGFIAQEVQSVVPETVSTAETGFLGMNYSGLAPVLVRAIQELSARVDRL